MIVYLLSTSPKNGVELMDGVESITRGWWRPTPGSIYPLLKEMTDQEIVRKRDDGRYELTAKGKSQMQWSMGPRPRHRMSVDDTVGQMLNLVSFMEDLKESDPQQLEPHMERLRGLAQRLSELSQGERAQDAGQ